MTRYISLTVLFISLVFLFTFGQSDSIPENKRIFYSNGFQLYKGQNVDSSLYFIRLLAADTAYSKDLQDLLHNQFASFFQKEWQGHFEEPSEITAYKTLEMMASDANRNLVNSAKSLYCWAKIQRNMNDNNKLIKITNGFIKTELSKDIFYSRAGRYALLIYQVISQKRELNKLAEKLLSTTIKKLKFNLVDQDSLTRPSQGKKVWYKYLYAYANFIEANKYIKQHNDRRAAECLKIAAEYSPDLFDRQYNAATSYDMYFLLGKEKLTFADEYLDFLSKHTKNNEAILSTLLTMALADPGYKENLKSFYDLNYPNREAFNLFWISSINKNLAPIIDFSLKQIDGKVFSTTDIRGKWALIDFWGTWCGPCRAEHPDLQRLYNSVVTKPINDFVFLTIACYDKENEVNSYISEFNYGFPVAMADNKIIKSYNVESFPFKILITPQGKYFIVPFGINWVDFIKKYADI